MVKISVGQWCSSLPLLKCEEPVLFSVLNQPTLYFWYYAMSAPSAVTRAEAEAMVSAII